MARLTGRLVTAGGSGNTGPGGGAATAEPQPGGTILVTFYGAYTDYTSEDQERWWTAAYAGVAQNTGDSVLAAIDAQCFPTGPGGN